MVAARIGAGDSATGITAKTIGHQPFATNGLLPIAAAIAAESQKRDLFSR